jgi:hypothetical protein
MFFPGDKTLCPEQVNWCDSVSFVNGLLDSNDGGWRKKPK